MALRWWPVLTPLLMLGLAASLISPFGRHEWELSLIRQPTRYTVLAFNRSWALPRTIINGRPVSVSFDVSNDEGRPTTYRFLITEDSVSGSKVLKTSSKLVRPGQTWTVAEQLVTSCGGPSCRIEVSLSGLRQSIDFLASVAARRDSHG